MIYTTKIIDFINSELNGDYSLLKDTPFFQGDPSRKKGNLDFECTPEEKEECWKVRENIIYLANTYCRINTPTGIDLIKLYSFQEKYLNILQENRFVVTLASRQVGKTLTSAIHCLDAILKGKEVLIIANTGATAIEIMDKIKLLYRNLPFYLKPGVISWNQASIKLDNEGSIVVRGISGPAIGRSFDLVYIDEAAFINPKIFDDIYNNLFSAISKNDRSQLIISSTPNGFNRFHKIYTDATNGANQFLAHKIHWSEVPGRDEGWKKTQIDIMGSEEAFNSEYDLSFVSIELLEKLKREEDERIKEKSLLERLERIESLLLNGKPFFDREYILKIWLNLSDDDIRKLGIK